jgi:outer membrane protein assembly factor BamB
VATQKLKAGPSASRFPQSGRAVMVFDISLILCYLVAPVPMRCFYQTGLLFLAGLLALNAAAADWPQFRGPQASGVDSSAPAPVHWNIATSENVRWRTPIPGLNIESANDQDTHEWHLLALEQATGKILWDKVEHEAVPRLKRHPKSSHCSSTPATDGKHVVAIFGSEGLFCFDMEGRLVWRKDLGPMDSAFYRVPTAQWGFGSSPVIHDGKAVVLCDVLTNSFIAAFDLADGRELWRTPRQDVPTWGTPTVVQVGDQVQVLVNGCHQSGAYDFATGREVWRLRGGGDIPVPTPILGNGLVYLTSAHGNVRPVRAIRLQARGDITSSEQGGTNAAVIWAHPHLGNYMQTPIVVGNQLYACFDMGLLTCFDAKTGAIRYSERLGSGAEGFSSSPVSDGRNLYFASELGNVFVVPAIATFSVVATNALEETCMATPALSNGTLFYRTREHLVCVGLTAVK